MAWLDELKEKYSRDKSGTIIKGLVVVQACLLVGWGTTTWITLHRQLPASPALRIEAPRPDDLGFLQSNAPGEFVIKPERNPFHTDNLVVPAVARPGRPGRVNAPPPKPNAALPTPPPPPPAMRNIEWIYKGLMVGSDGKPLALVENRTLGKSHFFKVGDNVDDGMVTGFDANTLVWEKSGQRVELKLGQVITVGQGKAP